MKRAREFTDADFGCPDADPVGQERIHQVPILGCATGFPATFGQHDGFEFVQSLFEIIVHHQIVELAVVLHFAPGFCEPGLDHFRIVLGPALEPFP